MAKKKFRIPGFSFSWKRASGLTSLSQKIARTTGVPTTKEGRRRKFGPFGIFALLGLFRAAHNSQPSPRPASSADVMTSCLGCLVGGGLLSVLAVAMSGGFIVLMGSIQKSNESQRSKASAVSTHQKEEVERVSASVETRAPAPAQLAPVLEPAPEAKPESKSPKAIPAKLRPVRKWTSADGQFTVEAEFISFGAGKVKLRRVDNGKELTLDEEVISAPDMAWIRGRFYD